MGQIFRSHRGPLQMNVALLQDIEWVLAMDTAAPRDVVAPLATKARDQIEAGYDPYADVALVAEVERTQVHDYLALLDVDAVQRLRGWNRLRYGSITVDARWLAEVRNVLDGLILSWSGCGEYAEELRDAGDADELAVVTAALAADRTCYRCERCQLAVLQERIDALLDAAGFRGSGAYQAYVAAARHPDPEAIWRDRVVAPAAGLGTAA